MLHAALMVAYGIAIAVVPWNVWVSFVLDALVLSFFALPNPGLNGWYRAANGTSDHFHESVRFAIENA